MQQCPPDRCSQGHAAVRRGRDPDPAEADLVRDLQDGALNLVYEPAESTGDAYEDAKVHLAQPEQ
jgi:hypothetical protein